VVEFQPGDGQLGELAGQVAGSRAVLVLGNVADTATIVRALRQRSPATLIYTGACGARASFAQAAGAAAEELRCPRLTGSMSLQRGQDYAALQCYDAVRMVVAAVRQGGLNRIRICKALAGLSPFAGAAGELRWSALNRNARPVTLGRIRGGRLESYTARAPVAA
jgi:ABC-type branched-subunit amino acid transport system substrate-binding protein